MFFNLSNKIRYILVGLFFLVAYGVFTPFYV